MKRKPKSQTPTEARKETEQYLTAGIVNPKLPGWPAKGAYRGRPSLSAPGLAARGFCGTGLTAG